MWQQYPELKQKNIPIQTYAYDPRAEPGTQLLHSVPRFGDGWFVVPYYFFTGLSIPATAINMRIFSLLWLGLTLFTIYGLCRQLAGKPPGRSRPTAETSGRSHLTLIFYVFNAAILWYHVSGYVHEIAVLPFYFAGWWLLNSYLTSPTTGKLLGLFLVLAVGVQFDWLPFFQAGIMSLYLFMERKRLTQKIAIAIPLLAVIAGAAFILYAYSQWVGPHVYFTHLKNKFFSRTVGGGGLQILPGLNYNFNILLFYAIGYGFLFLLFLYGSYKRIVRQPILWLMILTALAHHLVFWGFSTEHDYGVIKMAFPIAFIAASLITPLSFYRKVIAVTIIVTTNIGIYFFLHNIQKRPGMYANPDFCSTVGKYIHDNLPAKSDHVFINTEGKYLLPIEYYAQKPYIEAQSAAEAREILLKDHQGDKGYFLETKNGKIVQVTNLK